MAKKWQKIAVAATSVCLAATMAVSFTACGNKSDEIIVEKRARTGWKDDKMYTYNQYSPSIPSDWNELGTNDGNARDVYTYLQSPFFEFDFKFDSAGEIVPGEFEVVYSAATKLEDVTKNYIGQYGVERTRVDLRVDLEMTELKEGEEAPAGAVVYTAETQSGTVRYYYARPEGVDILTEEDQGITYEYYFKEAPAGVTVLTDTNGDKYYEVDPTNHVWKITLRNDIKWDDGTAINATDFVYSMQQQLEPKYLFKNASNYYSGNYILHNSQEYLMQGQYGYKNMVSAAMGAEEYVAISDMTEGDGGALQVDGKDVVINVKSGGNWGSNGLNDYFGAGYFDVDGYAEFAQSADSNGYVKLTKSNIKIVQDAIAQLHGHASVEEYAAAAGNYAYIEFEEMAWYGYVFEEMSFDKVGIFAGSNNLELYVVFDNMLSPIDENGDLTYEAAYYFQSLPLVKKDLWERCEIAPTSGTLYTTTYNSGSVANSASWGPYKLTNYQAGTTFTLERNTNWYGYNMSRNDDQYQTDRIVVRQIVEYQTALESFLLGNLDVIGIDSTVANDYRNSKQAYFTPSEAITSINLQSNPEALTKARNNAMLKYSDFRKALSLGIDRDNYAQTMTTSSLKSLGFFNEMHYYDVVNGGVYRHTTVAKEALLETYGATKGEDGKWTVGAVKYDDIDEAINALTGYNPTLAKELLTKAYNEALAAGDIDEGGTVVLRYGNTEESDFAKRVMNYYQNAFNEISKGTPLEGKIKIEFYQFSEATWQTDFANGSYDIQYSYWEGGAWNPYYFIGAYVDPNSKAATGWNVAGNTEDVMITLTVSGGGQFADVTATMNVLNWYNSLNGLGGTYDFSQYPTESRLAIVAALEKKTLESYWALPIFSSYSAGLMGYKCDYITYEYNTFMSYGGIQYMSYNFDDTEWAAFCAEHGELNYKH